MEPTLLYQGRGVKFYFYIMIFSIIITFIGYIVGFYPYPRGEHKIDVVYLILHIILLIATLEMIKILLFKNRKHILTTKN